MDWSNERYVRVYTRDTDDWVALSWQARSTLVMMLRAVDRAGILQTKRGPRGVAGLLRMPVEVVEAAISELVADGCIRECDAGYVLPNFVEAQEAVQTDAQRQRESRARRRDRQVNGSRDGDDAGQRVTPAIALVTARDDAERSVTRGDDNVTLGHARSLQPSQPSQPEEERRSRYESAKAVFRFMESERLAIDPQARATAQIHCEDQITRLLASGNSEDDLLHVVRVYASEARAKHEDKLRWFNGSTMWQPDNVERAKSRTLPKAGTSAAPADGLREGGSKPVRPADADQRALARIAELDAEAEARRVRGAK